MERVSLFHKVIIDRAEKGKIMVDKIRECYKEQGWYVDERDVRANGVDLVAWTEKDPYEPAKGSWYEVCEITNWNPNGFCLWYRLNGMIGNLNSEERNILRVHPNASVVKILCFNYCENFRKIGLENVQVVLEKNHILLVFGEELVLEEVVSGWID